MKAACPVPFTALDTDNLINAFESRARRFFVNSVDTVTARPKEQFELWRQCSAGLTEVTRPDADATPFSARMINYYAPPIGYARHMADHASIMHRHERIISDQENDVAVIQLRVHGREQANSFKSGHLFTPGDIRVTDMSQPFLSETAAYENIAIVLPKKDLRERIPFPEALHGAILPDAPLTRILRAHMTAVLTELPHLSQQELDRLATASLELVTAALEVVRHEGVLESETMETALYRAFQLCIEKNLHRPGLTADGIALMIGVSRTRLYDVCKPFGTPMELLQRRRLHRAAGILKALPETSIFDLAFSVGYETRETFSRAFRREFGVTAREMQQYYRTTRT